MGSERLKLGDKLALRRCPHCRVAQPLLTILNLEREVADTSNIWCAYECSNCASLVTAKGHEEITRPTGGNARHVYYVDAVFPSLQSADEELPEPARSYLDQAHRTVGEAHDAAAMVASSSVDAMLKDKGFDDSSKSLHDRIDEAVAAHLLTDAMGEWAHKVRLVSNDPRHADADNPHVSPEQARIVVEFAEALGQFLYVLPSRVARGMSDADRAADTGADD